MSVKNTLLSHKEALLLENLIAKHGLVVSVAQIFDELKKEKTKQEIYNLTSKMAKVGWLVRIRQGVYCIASLESRGTAGLSIFSIAQLIEKDSYISFEAALHYHSMFDQSLRAVRSVSLKKTKTVTVQDIEYEFIQTDEKLFYGFQEEWEGNQRIKVATAEKAILDILNYKRTEYMADIVLEKLRDYRDMIDWKNLFVLAKKQNLSVQRTLGFLLDKINIDTTELHDNLKTTKGYNRLTQDDRNFNAKWRLYYSNHFQ